MHDWLAPLAMLVVTLAAAGAGWLVMAPHDWRAGNRHLAARRFAEAERCYRRARVPLERRHGPKHWRVALLLYNVAVCTMAQGKLDETERLLDRALAIVDRFAPLPHPQLALVWSATARLRLAQGRPSDAIALLQRGLPYLTTPASRAEAIRLQLHAHLELDDVDGALVLVSTLEDDDATLVSAAGLTGDAAMKAGKVDTALECYDRALTAVARRTPRSSAEAFCRSKRAEALARRGSHGEARDELARAIADYDRIAPGQSVVVKPLLLFAASALELGDLATAARACERALEIARPGRAVGSPYRSGPGLNSELEEHAAEATRMLERVAGYRASGQTRRPVV